MAFVDIEVAGVTYPRGDGRRDVAAVRMARVMWRCYQLGRRVERAVLLRRMRAERRRAEVLGVLATD